MGGLGGQRPPRLSGGVWGGGQPPQLMVPNGGSADWPKAYEYLENHDFGGFRPSNHGGSIGLAERYSKMGIDFSGDE